MANRMTRQSPFLNDDLKEANQHKRQQKLRYANADQINAVSELVMNTLRGAIRPGRKTVHALKPSSHSESSSEYKKAQTIDESTDRSRCLERIKPLLSLR